MLPEYIKQMSCFGLVCVLGRITIAVRNITVSAEEGVALTSKIIFSVGVEQEGRVYLRLLQ